MVDVRMTKRAPGADASRDNVTRRFSKSQRKLMVGLRPDAPNCATEPRPSRRYVQFPGVKGQSFQSPVNRGGGGAAKGGGAETIFGADGGGGATHAARLRTEKMVR